MTTKKTDSSTVGSVENQEDWDKLMKFSGLVVTDLYQDWQGPCKPVVNLFNKLYALINSDSIKFSHVKVDNIRSLNLYKGKCEPTFLLFGSGHLVGIIRGINAPVIKDLCLLKYDEETKVIRGEIERVVIRDPGIKRLMSLEDALAEDIYDFEHNEMTFAIIKPDVIKNGKLDEVIEKLKEEGFDINRKEIRQLSREEILSMYNKLRKEEYFEEIITYMSTGQCCIMALSCDLYNAVTKLREITGPTDVEKARKSMSESLRAIYGLSGYRNGIHVAESREEALKSISVFFPDLILKKVDRDERPERTVVAIPINCFSMHMQSILDQFAVAELITIDTTETAIPKVDIAYLYAIIMETKELMIERIEEMYGSKFKIICFQNKNCLNVVKYMLGLYTPEIDEIINVSPLSLSGLDGPDLIYTSFDKKSAIRDIKFFFRIEVTFAIIKPDAFELRDEIIKLIKSAGFNIPIASDLVLPFEVVEDIYRNVKNMPFYAQHIAHMTSGTCLAMVLSKYNAILDWRYHMGSVNPEEASEESPHKLRGIFGSSLIENALHGASNKSDAMRCIKLIFGNVQFDERGNVCGHKSPDCEENYPITLYVPANIDESRIIDILKKLCYDKGFRSDKYEKVLSLKDIAKLYSTIKCYESHPNVKCFIVAGGCIIPVIQHEENIAFEKLEKINAAPKTQKNFDLRLDLWMNRIMDKSFVPETNYNVYKLLNEIPKAVSVEQEEIEEMEVENEEIEVENVE